MDATSASVASNGASVVQPDAAPKYFWNGYPVTVRGGLLYTAEDHIPLPEADRCAHHHGFQCAERMVKAITAANLPQPAAPAPAQPTPAPPAAPVEPKAPQAPPAPAEEQHLAKERTLASIHQLIEALGQIDMEKLIAIEAKKFLKALIPIDQFIDDLDKVIGKIPTPRK